MLISVKAFMVHSNIYTGISISIWETVDYLNSLKSAYAMFFWGLPEVLITIL